MTPEARGALISRNVARAAAHPIRRNASGSAFVSTGRWYSCALRGDATQVCWAKVLPFIE